MRRPRADLLTLQGMTAGIPAESFGFHVQQAAEKVLKAWLDETYPLTPTLAARPDLLADRGIETPPFRALVASTPYAGAFRDEGVAEPIDRDETLGLVEALLERVRVELPASDETG